MTSPNSLANDLDHVLTHTASHVWDGLRGARIFITGGTGFFGRWLLESLAWANDRLGLGASAVVLTRDPARFASKAPHLVARTDLTFMQGDVRDFSFPDGRFTHLIHAATEATVTLNVEQPLVMLDTIVAGTRRALDFAVHAGIKRFLLTSSGAVYGRQPPDLSHVPETYLGAPDTTDPNAAYGEGKRMAETLCCMYARRFGLESSIARCFAFVGPYLPLDAHFAAGNFLRDAFAGGPIRVGGDGTPYRSYLHAADLAIWLWTLLVSGPSTVPVNVGSDEAVSIANLAGKVAELAMTEVVIAKPPTPGAATARYVPDVCKAKQLGLQIRLGLEDALQRTFDWIKLSNRAKRCYVSQTTSP